jgi:ADP-ribose pyrophosphatase YjhB (NUDIX family)
MVILSPDGTKTLVAKRKKEPDMDGWQIPGGTVDYDNGENLANASVREVEEETGIKIENPELLCVMNTFYFGKDRPLHIGFVGFAKSEEIPPNPEPHKAEDWHWVELKNLPEGKWFRMSRVALDFYNKLKLDPEINRSIVDEEFDRV